MALRVLLADESSTIKKVMQLALQDFTVEIKSVPSGLDVIQVAHAFHPDIVFADVLLQKKSGYEVCRELKNEPNLQSVPVVIMWSSFMDLDEKAYQDAKADGRLEKPFETEALRSLVQELVPHTRSSPIASFLNFPGSFTEPLAQEESQKRPAETKPSADTFTGLATHVPHASMKPDPTSNWNMESFEKLEEIQIPNSDEAEVFSQVDLSKVAPPPNTVTPLTKIINNKEGQEPWAHQDLSRFKVKLPPVEVESEEFSLVVNLEQEPVHEDFLSTVEKRPLDRQKTQNTAAPVGRMDAESDNPFLTQQTHTGPNASAVGKGSAKSTQVQSNLEADEDDNFTFSQFQGLELDSSTSPTQPLKSASPSSPTAELPQATQMTRQPAGQIPELSRAEIEELVREQARAMTAEMVKSMVQKMLPSIAAKLIEQEIAKIMNES